MTMKSYKVILLVVLFLFFVFRLPGLGKDISNSDAARWHRRSEDFLNALKSGNFAYTYQHYQPGVTLMWLDAIVNDLSFKYQVLRGLEPKTLENSTYYPVVHGISKVFIVLVLGLLLFIQILLVRNIYGAEVSLVYGLFMSVEPYLIGINRWFHVTSLETFFSFTSFLFILNWYKFRNSKYLGLSSVFLGLSVLSKLTTLIIIPVYLIVFILGFRQKKDASILIFGLVFVLTFFIFFPAMMADTSFVVSKLSGAVFKAVTDNYASDMIPAPILPIYYFVILGLKLSPVTIIIFIISLIFLTKSKEIISDKFRLLVFLNLLLYLAVLSFSEQKIDRYSIAMFPSIILISSFVVKNFLGRSKLIIYSSALIFIILISYIYFPVYSAYYSPVLGGTETALKLGIYDNSGEFYAQAADYLSKKDRNNNVFVPFNYESFSYYYNGNMQREYDIDTDYLVTSVEHLDAIKYADRCIRIDKIFGSKEKDIVYVLACENIVK